MIISKATIKDLPVLKKMRDAAQQHLGREPDNAEVSYDLCDIMDKIKSLTAELEMIAKKDQELA